MRIQDNLYSITVTVLAAEVIQFKKHWPCNGLSDQPVSFSFSKSNGDLFWTNDHQNQKGADFSAILALVEQAKGEGVKRGFLPAWCCATAVPPVKPMEPLRLPLTDALLASFNVAGLLEEQKVGLTKFINLVDRLLATHIEDALYEKPREAFFHSGPSGPAHPKTESLPWRLHQLQKDLDDPNNYAMRIGNE